MPFVRNFIRHCSTNGLKEYFAHNHIGFNDIDWSKDRTSVTTSILQSLNCLPVRQQEKLRVDAERIQQMSDEVGQAALLSVLNDHTAFGQLSSAVDRSRWAYLYEPELFNHAEDIRYTDQYRHSRCWSGYQLTAGLNPTVGTLALASFKDCVKQRLNLADRITVELFERRMPDEEGIDQDALQIMVYQEELPNTYLEFGVDGMLTSRVRRPVTEQAITYCQVTGVIEVVAAKHVQRERLARAFVECCLSDAEADIVQLREYQLSVLMHPCSFPTDPEDGIESVEVVMIKLQDEQRQGRLTVEVPRRSRRSLYDYLRDECRVNLLTIGRFFLVEAKLSIRFQPRTGSNRKQVLNIKLGLPNRCDLRSRTERERLIGEKYLQRWGLIREV